MTSAVGILTESKASGSADSYYIIFVILWTLFISLEFEIKFEMSFSLADIALHYEYTANIRTNLSLSRLPPDELLEFLFLLSSS